MSTNRDSIRLSHCSSLNLLHCRIYACLKCNLDVTRLVVLHTTRCKIQRYHALTTCCLPDTFACFDMQSCMQVLPEAPSSSVDSAILCPAINGMYTLFWWSACIYSRFDTWQPHTSSSPHTMRRTSRGSDWQNAYPQTVFHHPGLFAPSKAGANLSTGQCHLSTHTLGCSRGEPLRPCARAMICTFCCLW